MFASPLQLLARLIRVVSLMAHVDPSDTRAASLMVEFRGERRRAGATASFERRCHGPLRRDAGDILLLPHGDAHVIRTRMGTMPPGSAPLAT
jgi:hypothetical protein